MNTDPHRDDLRVGYLLGAVSDEEARAYEETAVDALSASIRPVQPSDAFRAELMALIGGPARAVEPISSASSATAARSADASRGPITRSRAGRRRSRPLVVFASLAAAAALIVGGFTVSSLTGPGPDASSALATVTAASDAHRSSATFSAGRASVTLVSSASLGRSVAIVTDAPAVEAGHTYTLWYIRGGKAVAAGTFTPSAGSRSVVALDGTYRPHDVVAATVEPSTGSTQPTTPPVFEVTA